MWGIISSPFSFFSFAEQIQILPIEETQKLATFFNSQNKDVDYQPEEHLQRWELRKDQPAGFEEINPHDTWFPISFDEKGNISSGEIAQQYTYAQDYPVLQRTTKVAVEALAQKLNWKNETHLLGMSLIQHQMVLDQEYELEFHQDESRYTMVVLLNDEKGWTGGNLCFRSMAYHWIQQTFRYQQGYGVLFANEGKQHAVTKMKPISDGIERTILTIHEKGCISPKNTPEITKGRFTTLLSNSLECMKTQISWLWKQIKWPK